MACRAVSAPLSVKIHTMNMIMMFVRRQSRLATRAVAAAFVSVALASTTSALEVSGVRVDERVKLANQELVLNGAGIRYAAAGFVRVYVAALYLPQKRSSNAELATLQGPKRISLILLRDLNANDLAKGLLGGMRANLSASDQQQYFDSISKLGAIFGQIPSLKKGERIAIDLIPGTGTVFSINSKSVAEPFRDESFFHALLQIWIGPKPIDDSLKPVLLGTVASNDNSVIANTRDRF